MITENTMSPNHHWRSYDPLDDIAMFDGNGAGPAFQAVSVTANCSSSDTYPECRIAVHLGTLASFALTLEQSAQLRAQLEQAEGDVRAGMERAVGVRPGQERGDG